MVRKTSGKTVWKDEKHKAVLKVGKHGFVLEIDGIWVIDASAFAYGKHIQLRTQDLDSFDGHHSGKFVHTANMITSDRYYETLKHFTFDELVAMEKEAEEAAKA